MDTGHCPNITAPVFEATKQSDAPLHGAMHCDGPALVSYWIGDWFKLATVFQFIHGTLRKPDKNAVLLQGNRAMSQVRMISGILTVRVVRRTAEFLLPA